MPSFKSVMLYNFVIKCKFTKFELLFNNIQLFVINISNLAAILKIETIFRIKLFDNLFHMKLKKLILPALVIILIGIMPETMAQTNTDRPTRQSSMEAFSQGLYEKAYDQFSDLLITYPKDPLYKYYSGVCLTKLGRDLDEAEKLLTEAINNSASVKSLPSDATYYLGNARQMNGKFDAAITAYEQYADKVGRREAKEMGIPKLIQQCRENKGRKTPEQLKPVQPDIKTTQEEQKVTKPLVVTGEKDQKNEQKAANNTVPVNYEKILSEAVVFQYKADSVTALVNQQKKDLDKAPGNSKNAILDKIVENEKLAAQYQASADQRYKMAQAGSNSRQAAVTTNNQKNDLPPKQLSAQLETKKEPAKEYQEPAAQQGNTTYKQTTPAVKPAPGSLSVFEVVPVNDGRAKILNEPEIPAGLVYRIQIAVFRNPVPASHFLGIIPIAAFRSPEGDKTLYYAGMFRRLSDASSALLTVKAKGFKDAFVVALVDNKRISMDRAADLEKEWGNRILGVKQAGQNVQSVQNVQNAQTTQNIQNIKKSDTIPPTLTFRVEVMISPKPLKDDAVDELRKVAGNKGLDVIVLEDGKYDYLIGKFITFETASDFADLLRRNGYKDALVVAWLGKKEIPIETARQLFDNLK